MQYITAPRARPHILSKNAGTQKKSKSRLGDTDPILSPTSYLPFTYHFTSVRNGGGSNLSPTSYLPFTTRQHQFTYHPTYTSTYHVSYHSTIPSHSARIPPRLPCQLPLHVPLHLPFDTLSGSGHISFQCNMVAVSYKCRELQKNQLKKRVFAIPKRYPVHLN